MIVLPDRQLLAEALARIGIDIDPDAVPGGHYRAVRALDRATAASAPNRPDAPSRAATPATTTPRPYSPSLESCPGRTAEALAAWQRAGRPSRSGVVLWREPTPGATDTIHALQRAGLMFVVVTNSNGHGEENLRDCGFGGLPVIDSTVVGVAKPDPRIFEVALDRAGVTSAETVHVGDTLANDVAGARAAGITPIHFDPLRTCRATDHRHVRTLAGIWRHVAAVA